MENKQENLLIEKTKEQMRNEIETYLSKQMGGVAMFIADKLVTLSNENNDILLLAKSYFAQQEFKKIINLITKRFPQAINDIRCLQLVASSLCELQEWEKCLEFLGDKDTLNFDKISQEKSNQIFYDKKLQAVFCSLRGWCLEEIGNNERAVFYYQQALTNDPFLFDIFKHLVDSNMITELQECFEITSSILEEDENEESTITLHISTLVQLNKINDLFKLAHKLASEYPDHHLAWFSIGCYYYLLKQYEKARAYFSKSTTINQKFEPAWLAFGLTFSKREESDHAMTVYRTAQRLFPGSWHPFLYIGMEYLLSNNFILANQFLKRAENIFPDEPLIYNEQGVIAMKNHDFENAIKLFLHALSLYRNSQTLETETTLFNIGHSFRKMKMFSRAIEYYKMSLAIKPKDGTIYSALGFTYHLKGKLDKAIDNYHQSLNFLPENTFASEMLSRALSDSFSHDFAYMI
ncbi:cell division cycle protein [Anaeramoeba ignava]|uniref:Cell division cycle protein n=1 Tax=Anaeramoeba ignava TaxID=1746090 RepID=A0A9Q0LPV6_ANAIG|nr:cell division cycle protein [Anaeramoeba ignava]